MRCAGILTSLALCAACQSNSVKTFEPDRTVDPSGCILEEVAVEKGTNHYQYDSFSPDGGTIAIAWDRGEDERGTFLLNLKTGEREDVRGLNNGATFSPDGRYLLNSIYVSAENTEIAQLQRANSRITILAPHETWDWLPSFSPDGSKILFNSFRTGNSDIYLYDVATKVLDRLTDSPTYEAHAQFSPDGQSIVYHEQISDTDFNIKRIELYNRNVTNLTTALSEESYPSWSPDGRYIAIASDRDQSEPGMTDIFVMTAAGNVLHKITNTPQKDGYPFWSPDGEYLYFTSYREPQGVYRTKMSDFIYCERRQ